VLIGEAAADVAAPRRSAPRGHLPTSTSSHPTATRKLDRDSRSGRDTTASTVGVQQRCRIFQAQRLLRGRGGCALSTLERRSRNARRTAVLTARQL